MISPTHDSEIPDDDFQRRHGSRRAGPVVSPAERIAELEATVARLTAPPSPREAFAARAAIKGQRTNAAMCGALTAFLERRMRG